MFCYGSIQFIKWIDSEQSKNNMNEWNTIKQGRIEEKTTTKDNIIEFLSITALFIMIICLAIAYKVITGQL